MSELNQKQCPKCEEVKTTNEFVRPNAHGRAQLYKICNDCERYERTLDEIRERKITKSLTVRKPVIKPVWMVVYRSFP